MASYDKIEDSEIAPESPITSSLMTRLRDNPEAIASGAAGAPPLSGVLIDSQTFTSDGTLDTSGYDDSNFIIFHCWGGGGSGAKIGSGLRDLASGGGGGGYIKVVAKVADVPDNVTVTIGSGGSSVTSSDNAGNDGGDTTIDIGTVYGGAGGNGGKIPTDEGPDNNPGPASGGGAIIEGSEGKGVIWSGADSGEPEGSGDGLASIYGGGGGASIDVFESGGSGGVSLYGGNGGASSVSSNASDGNAPGGGGGATGDDGSSSGAGARGEVRVLVTTLPDIEV